MRTYEYIKTHDGIEFPFVSLIRDDHLLNITLVDEITGAFTADLSEVTIYNRGDARLVTYTNFNTLYRLNGKLLQLSNDGSVYIEPKPYQYIRINGGEPLNVESAVAGGHVLNLTFAPGVDVNEIDFTNPEIITVYSEYDALLQTYEGFITTYRILGQLVQLSDDGSIYDPNAEHAAQVAEAREAKIPELSGICNTFICNGVDVEFDGVVKHFSFSPEDQQNLKAAFDLSVATKMSVPYHADNDTCVLYTPEQIAQIYIAEQLNLTHHQTYFNQLKQTILAMDDVDAIQAVTYGQELTGEYLQTYQAMMAQTQAIINAMIAGA